MQIPPQEKLVFLIAHYIPHTPAWSPPCHNQTGRGQRTHAVPLCTDANLNVPAPPTPRPHTQLVLPARFQQPGQPFTLSQASHSHTHPHTYSPTTTHLHLCAPLQLGAVMCSSTSAATSTGSGVAHGVTHSVRSGHVPCPLLRLQPGVHCGRERGLWAAVWCGGGGVGRQRGGTLVGGGSDRNAARL